MPHDLRLSSTLIGSNYPCLELIFMVPKVFQPLKFDCILIDIREYFEILVFEIMRVHCMCNNKIRKSQASFQSI